VLAEVLFTDEFLAWWNGLKAEEQKSVGVAVELLEKFGVLPAFLTAQTSRGPENCANYASSIAANPTGFSMHSIQRAMQFCFWAAIKPESIAGMKNFPLAESIVAEYLEENQE
jgi:hypothetical protein